MKADREGIDWEAVRRRLDASRVALDAALNVSPERLAEISRIRAAALAAPRVQVVAEARRTLVVELGVERYGLDFGDVVGVQPFEGCTPVPGGPRDLLGVMNVGGELRSILDLGGLIGLPARQEPPRYVLLVRAKGKGAALAVDRLDRVRLVAPGEIASRDARRDGHFVTGLTLDAVRLLDTVAILSHPVFRVPPTGSDQPVVEARSP